MDDKNKIIEDNLKKGSWRGDEYTRELKDKRKGRSNIIFLGLIILFFTSIFGVLNSNLNVIEINVLNNFSNLQLFIILLALTTFGVLLVLVPNYPDLKEIDRRFKEADSSNDYEIYKTRKIRREKDLRKIKKYFVLGVLFTYFPFIIILIKKVFNIISFSNIKGGELSETAEALNSFFMGISSISSFGGLIIISAGFLKLASLLLRSNVTMPIEETVRNILNQIFEKLIFDRERGLTKEEIDNTFLIKSANTFKSNDYIEGKYKGIGFVQSDIEYSYKKTDENNSKNIFNGRWLIVENKKKIEGRIYIYNKNFETINKKYIRELDLEIVEMEDLVFNNNFEIYATNPHEVFYILTPALMERLKLFADIDNIRKNTEGIGVYCKNNEIHFAINGIEDAFHFSEIVLSELEIEKRLANDISLIVDIIDILLPNYKK